MKSKGLEPPAIVQLVRDRAVAAYDEKESEYPVMAGLYRFSQRTSATGPPGSIDRRWPLGPAAIRSAIGFGRSQE